MLFESSIRFHDKAGTFYDVALHVVQRIAGDHLHKSRYEIQIYPWEICDLDLKELVFARFIEK